ncbi:helix-turn-helix protein [Comamonas sp. BIGb0124]|uniref:helix-turn-helix domain-containing protein n=1 Tax=Comamonas sp. BIGb0124 TaxID=2485130 RepID=UPI000F4AC59C|nr:helix-turn-helix transcriptional regulator [Comamonas sp. BIGb0124]ROR24689.1 helix-turn-helix protein [Comamonas sp. BIGb0124]
MDLSLVKPDELVKLLAERLRKERLVQQMTQSELAARSGIGVATLSNLEAGRNTAFEGVVRVAMALGRRDELEALFMPKLDSLDDIRRYESGAKRQRIKKTSNDA